MGLSHAKAATYNHDIYKAQQELTQLGYSVGTVDGFYGRKTKNALKKYQRAHNLRITGWLDAKTKALLFKITEKEPSRIIDRGVGGIVEINSVIKNSYKKKHALVIGINAYPTMPLEAAVADAKSVSKRLKALNFEVTTLIDHEASKYRIQSELGSLAHTTKNDQVLIYFAGHGVTERLHNNKLEGYILPIDVNLRNLYATAISMKDLRDLTSRIPAKHILYVFDSCYSGLGLTRATTTYSQKYLTTLAGKRAVYMITAGKEGEVAREIGGHGIFTLNFLDGIAGAADTNPKDNVVQASELGVYLARAVSKDTKNEQNPQHGLLEGNGDFLLPLQDDDPIRLRQSQIAKLKRQTLVLTKRQDLQNEFDKIMTRIIESDKKLRVEYNEKIVVLDQKIKKKEAELAALSKAARLTSTADLNRSPYSVMRFLNTGVEFNLLKTFSNIKKAEEYYSRVFGMKFDLDKDGYKKDDKRKILLSRAPAKLAAETEPMEFLSDNKSQIGLSGIIDTVLIGTVTMSEVIKEIKHISSPLRQDNTTFVEYIHIIINNIDQKRLTFDQIKARLIARYGKHTSIKKNTLKVINWKTGEFQPYNEFIWEDNEVLLFLRTLSDKDRIEKNARRSLIEKNYITLEEYNKWVVTTATINIYLQNNSPILRYFYAQAYKIAELEELAIEKKANLNKLNF
jgi:hypothetical protein